MRHSILSILIPVFALQVASCHADITTVYLVRHAEKQTGKTADKRNPVLSKAGEERAKVLARTLRSAKLHACIASEYKRTQLTATQAATAANLKVTERRAGQEAKLAAELKKDFSGKNILFVGHSNTVPALLRRLGATTAPKIAEHEYDNLFILHIHDNGQVNVTRMHYGAQDPSK